MSVIIINLIGWVRQAINDKQSAPRQEHRNIKGITSSSIIPDHDLFETKKRVVGGFYIS